MLALCTQMNINKEFKANYIPYTYTMLSTHFNNFEMFGSPYRLLSTDASLTPHTDASSTNNLPIYAFLAKF